MYALLSETVDKMTALFEDIKEKQDNAQMQLLMQKMWSNQEKENKSNISVSFYSWSPGQ